MTDETISVRHLSLLKLPLLFIVGYVVSGKLALMLALPPGYAAAIFPPAGIALAAALIGGRRTAVWTFMGSLLLNLWVGYSTAHVVTVATLFPAALIAGASALQALAGGILLRRMIGYPSLFDQVKEVALLLLLVPLICLVNATISVSGLVALGAFGADAFARNWFTWWIGDSLGVIVIMPIALALAAEPRAQWRSRLLSIAIPMLIAFSLVVLGFIRASRWEQDETMVEFRSQAQRLADRMQTHLEEQEILLGEMEVFFSHSDKAINSEEFQRLVSRSLVRFPMLQAIEWAPRVDDNQRAVFETAQQKVIPGFGIKQRDANDQFENASDRNFYYPVLWAEPRQTNAAALGFDLASSADRRLAVFSTIKYKIPVATAPLRLAQEQQNQLGILLLINISEGGNAPGVVALALRFGDFIEQLLPRDRSTLSVHVTDIAAQQLLYGQGHLAPHRGVFEQTLVYGTREYLLPAQPSALYLAHHRGWQSWSGLVLGLFGIGLLGALLLLASGSTARVELQVAERTKALALESDKNRLLLRNSSDGVTISDADGTIIEASDSFWRMLGFSRDDVIGSHISQWDPSVPAEEVKDRVAAFFQRGEYLVFETTHPHRDGHFVDVEVACAPLELNGKPVLFASARDITERKRSQAILRESEAKLRGLYDLSPLGIALADMHGHFVEFNEAFRAISGYTEAELKALDYWTLTPAKYHAEEQRQLEFLARTGQYGPYEKEYIRKDGSLIPLQLNGIVVNGHDGQQYIWSIVEDITARKQAESELRDQKEFLSVILENSSVGVTLVKDRKLIWANREMGAQFGYASDEMKNMSTRTLYISQNSYEQFGHDAYPVLSQGSRYVSELELQRRDGSHVWMSVSGQSIQSGNLAAADTIWIFKDISRRKTFEVELAATRERLMLALRGADLALLDWDMTSGRLFFGEGWVPLLGYATSELPLRRTELTLMVHPEDTAAGRAALNSHLSGKHVFYESEIRMRHKDGRWIWVSIRGMAVEHNATGEAIRWAGTAMNVTGRKHAQAEIVRLSQWNELLLNSAGEGIYGIDQNECCIFINPAGLAMLGMDKADIIGKKPHELFHAHYIKEANSRPDKCSTLMTLKDGIRREGEELFVRNNGDIFTVRLTVTPMQDNNRLIGAEVVFQDITDRKAMENELLVLATTDSLTRCANRHRLLEQMHTELSRVKRFGKPAAFLMIDIDHFKKINDTYGHAIGDAALQHFSELVRHRLRSIDLFGRLGGEEFGILLPGTDAEGARIFAERLRSYVADTPVQSMKGPISFAVSVGVSTFEPEDLSPDTVLGRADDALYRAKALGRNRVEQG